MDGNPHLKASIESLIRRRGQIPFSDYMREVLYNPIHGYYASQAASIGAGGDFYTAANLDPAMGQLLAKLFRRMAEKSDRFELVEIGAGTGLLARHILEQQVFPYTIVENSVAMRQRQRETLADFHIEWRESLPDNIEGCVFSNEFFDALPVRRFVRRGEQIRELFVAENLSEVEDAPEIELELPLLRDGCVADICLEAEDWLRRIGKAIRSGYHLAIDYGYLREEFFSRSRGTLMCYRRHLADEDPYSAIGEKDITAHVNFSDLIDTGRGLGLEPVGFRSQMTFLIDMGILELMEPLSRKRDAGSVQRLEALKTLLLPPMMGERFKVLLQRKGLPAIELPGFQPGVGP